MKNRRKVKKIGIIGGVGPQATSVLYGHIIRLAQEKYGAKDNDDYPNIVIHSIPIKDFISDKNQMREALEMLYRVVRNFEKIGCSNICIASNTVHLLIPKLRKITNIPFLSMINLVAQEANKRNFRKVGLVGSPITLKAGLYDSELIKLSIDVLKPDKKDQLIIEKIIRYVLAGEDNGRERMEYIQILNNLVDRGSEGIILGCTELPLAINYEALGGKIINSMRVLAEGIVDYYYN
jgi:aspartate racemase